MRRIILMQHLIGQAGGAAANGRERILGSRPTGLHRHVAGYHAA